MAIECIIVYYMRKLGGSLGSEKRTALLSFTKHFFASYLSFSLVDHICTKSQDNLVLEKQHIYTDAEKLIFKYVPQEKKNLRNVKY